jgi:hypothetical protein
MTIQSSIGRACARACTVAAPLAIALSAADARAFAHVVQAGETLAQIADRVYGDAKMETVLVGANALDAQGGSAIVAGMRLEIPAPAHFRVLEHETWEKIAIAWLGDAKRADMLARANGGVSWIPPVDGQEIVIPAVIAHIAAEGDSTSGLALRYWGNANRAWELDAYNGRKPGALHRGDVMLVPLADLTLTERGRAEARHEEAARRESASGAHDAQKRADSEIPTLLAHVHRGRYVDAVALGNRLLGSGEGSSNALTNPQLATIHRALLEAYVALDALGAAAGACAAWRAAATDVKLDPRLVSPKIRAQCK